MYGLSCEQRISEWSYCGWCSLFRRTREETAPWTCPTSSDSRARWIQLLEWHLGVSSSTIRTKLWVPYFSWNQRKMRLRAVRTPESHFKVHGFCTCPWLLPPANHFLMQTLGGSSDTKYLGSYHSPGRPGLSSPLQPKPSSNCWGHFESKPVGGSSVCLADSLPFKYIYKNVNKKILGICIFFQSDVSALTQLWRQKKLSGIQRYKPSWKHPPLTLTGSLPNLPQLVHR